MSTNHRIDAAVELAKSGRRLNSEQYWKLADALTDLSDTEIQEVAIQSGRTESTLHQYKRAAERWPKDTRVTGVSFSAHRVALSWHDPATLLKVLKHRHGSPTVQQVRQAMGLEGHPGMELIERGMAKLDRKVSATALEGVILKLKLIKSNLVLEQPDPANTDDEPTNDEHVTQVTNDQVTNDELDVDEPELEESIEVWTPPIRVNDIAGM